VQLGSDTVGNGHVGGNVRYFGGSGADSLTVTGANAFNLTAYLGAGADTFTYAAGASVGGATIDFGVDSDTDVFTDNGVTVTWSQQLVNFP
jgi:hypothetical protein